MNTPKYFTFAELTTTNTGKPNNPSTWEHVSNLMTLGLVLDAIRAEFGKPIRVNSAFRTEATNAAVGGSKTSMHMKGLAADICAWSGKEVDNRELLKVLERQMDSLDQLISYHKTAGKEDTPIRFIHVGLCRGTPRKQRLYK